MLACSIVDATPYKTQFKLTGCTCDPDKLQRPDKAEWHLTVTGFPKLHSDLLGSFEWLGY